MTRSLFLAGLACFRAAIAFLYSSWAVEAVAQTNLRQVVSDDPAARQSALRQLAALSERERLAYLPELTRMAREGGYRIVPAFAKIGPAAVPYLTRLVESPDASIRIVAVRSLGMMRPASPASVELFRRLLADSSVQRDAAASLLSAGIEDERARSIANAPWQGQPKGRPIPGGIPAWIKALSSRDALVRYDADMLLKGAGAQAVPSLLEALKTGDDRLRMGAADALEFMHSYRPDVEEACIQALKDPSPHVRDMAQEVLRFQISQAAQDALLDYEVAETLRLQSAQDQQRKWLGSVHTFKQLFEPIPPTAEHSSPLVANLPKEAIAPDGTSMVVVVYSGQEDEEHSQVLRVWCRDGANYSFRKELVNAGDDISYLSAEFFRFRGSLYLHLMTLHSGNGFIHEDELFRVERNSLTPIRANTGSPIKLAEGEGIAKGVFETFRDDDLRFEFGIWKGQDPQCCPSAMVKGTYSIVGNELRIATWRRSTD